VKAKPLRFRDEQITMAHGAGGKATLTLIEGLLAPAFGVDELADAAAVGEVAVTTDSFVVKPIRFPGGSIGELAVNGTVNDLAVGGARPLALTVSLVLEEGLPADVLRDEVEAIARAAAAAGAVSHRDLLVAKSERLCLHPFDQAQNVVLAPALDGHQTAVFSRAKRPKL